MATKEKPAMTKEEAYDSKVFPLMAQVIAICHEHKIAMLADFSLNPEEGLRVTTVLLDDDYEPTEEQLAAFNEMKPSPQRSPLMLTIDHGDGRETIAAIF